MGAPACVFTCLLAFPQPFVLHTRWLLSTVLESSAALVSHRRIWRWWAAGGAARRRTPDAPGHSAARRFCRGIPACPRIRVSSLLFICLHICSHKPRCLCAGPEGRQSPPPRSGQSGGTWVWQWFLVLPKRPRWTVGRRPRVQDPDALENHCSASVSSSNKRVL